MRYIGKRIMTLLLAFAIIFTSVSLPSVTADAASKTAKVKKIQITNPKKKTVTLNKGKTLQLKIKVTPQNAKNKKVTYKSSKKKIASVTKKGKIKALKNGKAKITVTAKDGSKKKAALTVLVVTPVSSVTLKPVALTLSKGTTASITATVKPSGASNKKLNWTTSNPAVATVSANGQVSGKQAGTATITATAADGSKKKASCVVTVKDDQPTPPQAVTLESIAVTAPPAKTAYIVGEKFDPAGMQVTASYSDKNKKLLDASAYTLTPSADTKLQASDQTITVSYTEGNVTKTAQTPITVTEKPVDPVEKKSLTELSITAQPTKTAYIEGEQFDSTGMEVTAVYLDQSTKILNASEYTLMPSIDTKLQLTNDKITVSYTEGDVTKTALVTITVEAKPIEEKTLTEITITTLPTKTTYIEGENFDASGMVVTAAYSDESTKILSETDYTIEPDRALTTAERQITVRYAEGSETKTASVTITVEAKSAEEKTLTGITITTLPTKTAYIVGESFDTSGMEVTAAYSDKSTGLLSETDYTIEPDGALVITDRQITVSYTEGNISKTAMVEITVEEIPEGLIIPTSISVTKDPDQTKYAQGCSFDPAGMEVTAAYSNGTTEVVEDYTITDGDDLAIDQETVTIHYTETVGEGEEVRTINLTVKYAITVVELEQKATGYFQFEKKEAAEETEVPVILTNEITGNEAVVTNLNSNVAQDGTIRSVEGVKSDALYLTSESGKGLKLDTTITSTDFSISMWVKADHPEKNYPVFLGIGENEIGWYSSVNKPNYFGVYFSKPFFKIWDFEDSTLLEAEKWKMLTMTRKGNECIFYVDGVEVGRPEAEYDFGASTIELYLGISAGNPTFVGTYDEISIYDFALTEGQVQTLYGRILPTIQEVTLNNTQLSFPKGSTAEQIQEALKELEVQVTMKNGKAPDFQSKIEEDWELSEASAGSSGSVHYTAKKELLIPEGYTNANQILTLTVNVEVKGSTEYIEVTTNPRTEYVAGELFVRDGMVITKTYEDSTKKVVTEGITIENETMPLQTGTDSMLIRYTEDETSVTETTLPITVREPISNLELPILQSRISYYSFDAGTTPEQGLLFDEWTRGNAVQAHASGYTVTGTPGTEIGVKGNALKLNFDDPAGGIKLDTAITTADYSISMWVKPDNGGTQWKPLFYGVQPGNKSNYDTWYHNLFTYCCRRNNTVSGEIANAATLGNGTWHMVTMTLGSGKGNLYVDGQYVGDTDKELPSLYEGESPELYIGTSAADGVSAGAYDEISIYNKALSADEVAFLYSQFSSADGE